MEIISWQAEKMLPVKAIVVTVVFAFAVPGLTDMGVQPL
jgi:hypothetical protein